MSPRSTTTGRKGVEMQVVTLDADPPGRGTRAALLGAAVDLARSQGCRRLRLVTSNANLDTVGFQPQPSRRWGVLRT